MNGFRLRRQKDGAVPIREAPGGTVRGMSERIGRADKRTAKRSMLLLGLALAGGAGACGASIQAVYEGDVRFEHCMALDAQPDVKAHIRRACWREWVSFYTYGQTRDRVRHAQMRIRQLSGVSEFVAGPAMGGGGPALADGTGPLASGAGGAATGATGGGPSTTKTGVPDGRARCVSDCEAMRDDCRDECRTHGCAKSCAMAFRNCITECMP